ncbi:MAG: hypothetical protein ACYTFI_26765 [Planctomycetota bacterium]|jgi:hypothetical protein
MDRPTVVLSLLCLLIPLGRSAPAIEDPTGADPGTPDKIDAPPALPKEFAFTFSMPYGQGDEFPREPEEFDRMLGLLKNAGFNTVHCPYEEWRVPLFKKHGMKMMVDVLAWKPPIEADIRRPSQRPKVKAMCLAVRDSDAVWGYNLWNERLDWCGNFEFLDGWVRMLRTWDPTHPVWVGTYRYLYCEHFPTHQGVCAWYDYHWARGFPWNLHQLNFYRKIAKKRRSVMGKWLLVHDYNRNLYTLNTSIAHGVKVVLWFIGGPYAPREKDKSKRWSEGHHLVRIGRHMRTLYRLIGEIGLPEDVYATPTRRRADTNADKKPGMEGNTTPFPEDFWLSFRQGEVLAGVFRHPDGSRVAYVCNQNAWAWQGAVMDVRQEKGKEMVVSRFDRPTGGWKELGARATVNFALPPADAAVFRFVTKRGAAVAREPAVEWDPAAVFAEAVRPPAVGVKANVTPAVYSTPDAPAEGATAFPADFYLTIKQGAALAAVYRVDDRTDVVVFSNRSPTAWQGMVVALRQAKDDPVVMSQFKDGRWSKLGAWGDVNFPLEPKGHSVFKFERPGAAQPAKPGK